jgi:DNA-binding transcriptional LysR family regulator
VDIRSLRYFLAVVDEGSFGAGARRASVSQPAISQAIAQLEEELSARLFDRGGRRVALTPDGEAFVESARRVVAEFDELPARLDRARGVVRGRLEIGTTDVASIYVLPRVYRAYRRRYPQVEISVRVEGTESLLRQLAARTIEIAVITLSVGDRVADVPAPFSAEPLFREQLDFLVSKGHPLAGRGRLALADLAEQPLITFKEDSITRQAVDALFREHGIEPRVAMEMSSPEAIKRLVEVGLGMGILPARSVSSEVRAGTLVGLPLRDAKLDRVLGVTRDPRRTPSPAAAAFLGLLEQIRNVPAGAGPGEGEDPAIA